MELNLITLTIDKDYLIEILICKLNSHKKKYPN